MRLNSSGSKLAPPTKTPSTPGKLQIAFALLDLTLPPYNTAIFLLATLPNKSAKIS
jgi:hypothetical protein